MQPSPVSKAKDEPSVCDCHVQFGPVPIETLGEPGQPGAVTMLLCENVPSTLKMENKAEPVSRPNIIPHMRRLPSILTGVLTWNPVLPRTPAVFARSPFCICRWPQSLVLDRLLWVLSSPSGQPVSL